MGNLPFQPETASTYAQDLNYFFIVLVALTLFFTVTVGSLLLFFAIKYRRGNKVDRSRPLDHNMRLELVWIGGPLVLALMMFVWSSKLFTQAFTPPKNAIEIFVIGKQWMWHIQHGNGVRENNELHIPVDEDIKLTMISQDVIHAFYVPAFRMQRHVEPGRYSMVWYHPTKIGKYRLFCNVYCGTQHSEMGGWVYVMSRSDYQKWLVTGGQKPVAVGGEATNRGGQTMGSRGADLYGKYQCATCHNADAIAIGRGPSLANLYNSTVRLANGRTEIRDDGYLRNVILNPTDYAQTKYPPTMPGYKGVLTEADVLDLIAYLKTIGTSVAPTAAARVTAGAQPGPVSGTRNSLIQSPVGTGEKPEDVGAAGAESSQLRQMYGEN